MKAYKVFNSNWTCNGFQYEIGKTYTMEETPILCEKGFHACKNVANCFSYYSFDPNNKVAEVILSGTIVGKGGDKQCSNKIKIVKEITWGDMLNLANTGIGNSGNWNSGDRNSGNSNSGDWNNGDCNSGDRNSGDRNSGNRNSGDWNNGDCNSGNSNSGNKNSGNWNSGDRNSGYFNSKTPSDILVFNKLVKREIWDNTIKPEFILDLNITIWVSWNSMTDKEKSENKDAYVTDGYLKTISYKEAWKVAYDNASKEDIKLLKALPNWSAKVFEEITGIKVK